MPPKIRDLRRQLRKNGFEVDRARGKGDHEMWVHPDYPESQLFLDGADNDDAKRYQQKEVGEKIEAVRVRRRLDR